jgi:predicted MFS family arabinose efflux permease
MVHEHTRTAGDGHEKLLLSAGVVGSIAKMKPAKSREFDDVRRNRIEAWRILGGGILGMMVAMGIGRFAYTPILPLMERDLGLSHAETGSLASFNYVGYLLGAVLCSLFPRLLKSVPLNVGALAASIATTLFMGAFTSPLWWGLLRFVGGIASAVLFVVIAVEVTEALAKRGETAMGGTLYGGIGLGIALSGFMVPRLDRLGGWQECWLWMGLTALALALVGLFLAQKKTATPPLDHIGESTAQKSGRIGRLATAYTCEGFGYIISATFIVAMVGRTPGLEQYASLSWVAVGLAAAPSTILWQQMARKFGVKRAALLAYAIQAAGILLSIRARTPFTAAVAAISFGGTFLGIVTLVMSEGNRRAGNNGRRVAALLTACFSAGQVVGPTLAGLVADRGGFTIPLLLAAFSVTLGGIIIATDRQFGR